MFRNQSGKLKWSWGKFILNAQPNFANNATSDADLSPKQKDDLFQFQLAQDEPKVLNEYSLYISGIVENQSQAPRILRDLKTIGVISPANNSIHTNLITRHFANQVPTLSLHRQRKLVCLLFFWEEELMRWRLLDEEEAEIRQVMMEERKAAGLGACTDDGVKEELKVALGMVRAKIRMPPAVREVEGQGDLPGYGDPGTFSMAGLPPR